VKRLVETQELGEISVPAPLCLPQMPSWTCLESDPVVRS